MRTDDLLAVMPDLVALVRVAEAGSFSAAARQYGLTPSAVSRQIARLEKSLGVSLMQRSSRHLQLTEAGVQVLAQGREMLAAARGALHIAEDHAAAPQGLVRLSAPKAYARQVLHQPLLDFLQRNPAVDVHLLVTDKAMDPLRDQVDIVVRYTDAPPLGLVARPLRPVRQVVLASPDYLRRHPPIHTPHDLIFHICLSLGEYEWDNHWRFTDSHGQAVEVPVKGRYTLNHSEMRLEAVIAGLGIGCVSDFVARQALATGQVHALLSDWTFDTHYQGMAWLLYPATRYRAPKVRALVEHLMQTIAAIAA